ncbi:endonuclease III domain-containing protein [Mucilaginibacter polytrichastri]|uniref:endonuclease III domain-containing protein n=1 Tax=Mucilaginibacter polytrichastri TaxID=1302689 RepID=UPI0008E29A7F|nr:Fe-S cluster assembly protein HesB [Mucilaginibacter polytrichastri]SFT20258.1 endonuclease-3 [Mucilaginibacter polytrichastri]
MLTVILDKAEFVLEAHHRLYLVYGSKIRYLYKRDPLSELVDTILSQRTKNRDSAQAFTNLIEQFGTWEKVRDAPVEEVLQAIKPSTWPEQKAPRLQQILRLITERRGELTLDFLADMDVYDARQWLEKLPGVGPKSSAATLSFSNLRARALPVDSHHFRVAVRLGIIDAKIGEGKANRVLENLLPESFSAKEVFDNHQVMMRHGQQVCFYYKPACADCVLLDLCPTGQELVNIQI